MAITIFGLTAASVQAHMFPQWGAPSVNSSPTLTVCSEVIDEEAGELTGKLYGQGITASALVAGTAAYLWCAKTLRFMAAIRFIRAGTQADPEVARAYAAELKQRLADLDAKGATALGDSALDGGDAPADGPNTHINTYGIDVSTADDMSSLLDGTLRRSDAL